MVKHAEEKCEVFAIDAGHSILVGESYLVAAAYRTGAHWFGEQFLLLERPTPRLDRAAVRLDSAGGQGNIVVIDLDFIVEEVKSLASRRFGSWLTMRYEETKTAELLAVKFDFAPCDLAALARCWMRGLYQEEINQIAAATQCGDLRARLHAFRALPVFTAG